jgi:hypothetical protein
LFPVGSFRFFLGYALGTFFAWQGWLALPETAQIAALEGMYAGNRIGTVAAPKHLVCEACGMQIAYALETCDWCA